MKIAVLIFLFCGVVPAQPKPIETKGACSPIATGDNNTFQITCGIGKSQGAQMLKILNKILLNQLDPDAVMAKLDEIQRGIDDLRNATAERTIIEVDAQRLIATLRSFSEQKASLMALSSDNEAKRLARRIQGILSAAQWDVPDDIGDGQVFGPGIHIGVELTVREQTPAATALLQSLGHILENVRGHINHNLKDDAIQIFVFSKR
jgi:hypothetical protein